MNDLSIILELKGWVPTRYVNGNYIGIRNDDTLFLLYRSNSKIEHSGAFRYNARFFDPSSIYRCDWDNFTTGDIDILYNTILNE